MVLLVQMQADTEDPGNNNVEVPNFAWSAHMDVVLGLNHWHGNFSHEKIGIC